MSVATYPTDYGYLRDTLGQDGDALDALVCLQVPTFPCCLIPVEPIGLFKMRDEKDLDDRIICVPLNDPCWNAYDRVDDLAPLLRGEIEQTAKEIAAPSAVAARSERAIDKESGDVGANAFEPRRDADQEQPPSHWRRADLAARRGAETRSVALGVNAG